MATWTMQYFQIIFIPFVRSRRDDSWLEACDVEGGIRPRRFFPCIGIHSNSNTPRGIHEQYISKHLSVDGSRFGCLDDLIFVFKEVGIGSITLKIDRVHTPIPEMDRWYSYIGLKGSTKVEEFNYRSNIIGELYMFRSALETGSNSINS